MHNDTTCDRDRSDLHQFVAVATGPRLKVERREPPHLVGIIDMMGRAADEHAPTFTQRLIDTIDLESDHRLGSEKSGFGNVGAEDDLPGRELEVDR